MAPDSRRSESCGRLESNVFSPPGRFSTPRFNWDKARIGMFNSLARPFNERLIVETSS